MAYTLCEKVRDLKPYEPISGTYRIRLDANESFYNMPDEIKSEIKSIIDTMNFNRYPDPTAQKPVKAFAAYYGLDPNYVTATNGSDEMLYLLASAMLQRNSKVVVVEPDFSMYRFYSFLSENQIITVQKNDMLKINVDQLIETSNQNGADMIIFSNPCNPTGQGITADEARKLVKNVNALVILDEAYMDFWNESLLKETAQYDNLIVLKTASKAIGSAAIRLGFAVANSALTRALQAVKSPYNVNTLSQEIGACIYSHKELLDARRDEIICNTKTLYTELLKLKEQYQLPADIFEPCTNFVLMRCDFAQLLFEYLLENGIAIRYFAPEYAVRITSGSANENTELLTYIERYILEKYLSESH